MDIYKQLVQIIKEYWCCFDPEAVKIPMRNYQAYIDTSNQKPVAVQNTRYGLHESPIMQKAIDGLLANDQIEPATDGSWLSRCTLAPKPHQEKITRIDDFI